MKGMSMTVPTTIAGDTDKRTQQWWQLATEVGQKLAMGQHKWQILSRDHTIVTTIGVDIYVLPTDFDGYVADSSWNRSKRLPVIGSIAEFEWQMLKARLLSGTSFTALFKVQNDKVVFYNVPTAVETIVLPYTSRGWVRDATDANLYKDNLEVDNDIVLYDPQLFKTALKLAWYEAKQFDTTKLLREYARVEAAAKANDVPGRTLSIAKGSDYPYLGVLNLPDTGYGS